jgi:arginase family enzyme
MISLLAAPTNLGLRPPVPNNVPGCAKAPEALREAGLYDRLITTGASDAVWTLVPFADRGSGHKAGGSDHGPDGAR